MQIVYLDSVRYRRWERVSPDTSFRIAVSRLRSSSFPDTNWTVALSPRLSSPYSPSSPTAGHPSQCFKTLNRASTFTFPQYRLFIYASVLFDVRSLYLSHLQISLRLLSTLTWLGSSPRVAGLLGRVY